eukprot:Gb_12260 [translate_table: standard]
MDNNGGVDGNDDNNNNNNNNSNNVNTRAALSDGIGTPPENTNTNTNNDAAAAPHQSVKVAVHIRPLIGHERMQGCKDCITVVPGQPQILSLGDRALFPVFSMGVPILRLALEGPLCVGYERYQLPVLELPFRAYDVYEHGGLRILFLVGIQALLETLIWGSESTNSPILGFALEPTSMCTPNLLPLPSLGAGPVFDCMWFPMLALELEFVDSVQIGTHSFTFDHVYGSTASPSSSIFEQCVIPLVDGLFSGYNATVLAYGQTGSGKTYTMGTGYTAGGSTGGIIPLVMETIFKKVEELKHQADFQIRVSFIEILKEEVHDLLDPNPPVAVKFDTNNGLGCGKPAVPVKPPIQIRENSNGGITLAGVTEADVSSQEEMASFLAHGSLCRATGSTNMNSQSSRSHAIFTITVEQKRKMDAILVADTTLGDAGGEDFLCAKLHLVDLAGSERAKRTGADGLRFKEVFLGGGRAPQVFMEDDCLFSLTLTLWFLTHIVFDTL